MKNKLIFILLAGTLLLATRTGIAGSAGETYVGIQYGVGEYSEEGISKDFNPTALIGRFGGYLTPNFSLEGRLGLGLQDDTQFLPEFGASGRDVTLELDYILGVYGTGHINLTESSSIYGLLGVSKVKGSASVPGLSALTATEDNSDLSYGIGADIGLGSNVALNIEYVRYLDKSDFDFSVMGIGVVFSF